MSLKHLFVAALVASSCSHSTTLHSGFMDSVAGLHYVPKIDFRADVDENSVAATKLLMSQAIEAGAEAIVIEFDTPGGSVSDGFQLTKAIEDSPVPVVCIVDGEAASMGFYLLQSCTVRLMTKRSSVMIHGPSIRTNYSGGYEDWENIASVLRVLRRTIVEHCAKRMKLTPDEVEARIEGGHDWWMDWREALNVGAVDGVVTSVKEVMDDLREDPSSVSAQTTIGG